MRQSSGDSTKLRPIDDYSECKVGYCSFFEATLSVIVLANPHSGELGCFVGNALPFGSTASVLYFNRVSRLLWRLGLELYLPWCNYYDDYPVFSPACLASSTMTAMVGLVKFLGFDYSSDKLHGFATTAAMLGVEVDCSNWKAGNIVVKNKESRSKEIQDFVANLQEGGHLTSREFLSIVGRLQFAEAQVMGRMGKLALSRIRMWMSQQRILVTRELLEEFRLLAERFRREKPREVPMLVDPKSVLGFTDGASEGDVHTVGGVLVFPDGAAPRLAPTFLDLLLTSGSPLRSTSLVRWRLTPWW